jgi:cytochrome c peroxidase
MHRMRVSIAIVAALPVVLAACAGTSTPKSASTPVDGKPAGDCSAGSSKQALRPISSSQTSSGIALAEQNGRTLALIADEDDKALHVIDVASRREISSVSLAGTPAHVMVASDGRVLVTLRDQAQVQILAAGDNGSLAARCSIQTPSEPIALAETPDKSKFVVTSGWGHSLDILASKDLSRQARVDLPREPRGVHISPDGTSAVVAHLVGSNLSVVDLATGQPRTIDTHGAAETRRINVKKIREQTPTPTYSPYVSGAYGKKAVRFPKPVPTVAPQVSEVKTSFAQPKSFEFTSREANIRRHSINGITLAMVDKKMVNPRVLVDPGEQDEVATYYGSGDRPSEVSDVLILDEKLQPVNAMAEVKGGVAARRFTSRFPEGEDGCFLPRAITENTADHTALVACLGSNMLLEYSIESLGATPRAVVRSRWPVAKGPSAVAYDAKAKQAIVWSQYDHAVTFVALPTGSIEERLVPEKDRVTRLNLARPASLETNGEVELGRQIYHTTGDHRISREGLACASCHPDGRDDALTWATQDGPRNAPMLAGRLEGTAPYAWNGSSDRVAEHLEHTVQRLGGSGLPKREMEALAAYCLAMKTYKNPTPDAAKVARGKEIFTSSQAKCSSCHAPGKDNVFTDNKKHDVASSAMADNINEFDTPSLRFVGGTAPYFHDGRYQNLRELLVKSNGQMGNTAHLAPADLDALEAYLKSL